MGLFNWFRKPPKARLVSEGYPGPQVKREPTPEEEEALNQFLLEHPDSVVQTEFGVFSRGEGGINLDYCPEGSGAGGAGGASGEPGKFPQV